MIRSRRTTRNIVLRLFLSALIAVSPLTGFPVYAATSPQATGHTVGASVQKGTDLENYDIRDDERKQATDAIERHRQKNGKERRENIRVKKEKMQRAIEQLERSVPGLELELSKHTGGPEIVGTRKGGRKLTGRSRDKAEKITRDFLEKNSDLYGLSRQEIAQLKKTADYANPAGNLSWIELAQQVDGLPIFRGELRAALSAEGELVRTTGNLVPALEDFVPGPGKTGVTPAISAEAAAIIGAQAIGVSISSLSVKSVSPDETEYVFEPGPFSDDVKVNLEYFPLDSGVLTLAWSMTLWQENAAYYMYVSAEEGSELLWRKNIVEEQSQPATYVVYNDDSPAPASPSPARPGNGYQAPMINRTSFTLVSEGAFNNLGWMTDGTNTTIGNNVEAGLDLVSPNGVDPASRPVGSPNRVFDFSYNPAPGNPPPGESPTLAGYRSGEVVDMFFWTNRYHDQLYQLGFTEAARNFQMDNFGRGGLGNDRVSAEGQDSSGTNNANFATPPDGSSGRMQMYIFTAPTPDRTSALDHDVLIHELTHGTSNRLHFNASGLSNVMSRGMGEGWSDYYGRVLLSSADEDVNGVYTTGGWVTLQLFNPAVLDNYYYGIRRFPYALKTSLGPNGKPFNPITFADMDSAQINLNDGAYPPQFVGTPFQVHNIGEIWCSALLEVRARLINRLGYAVGNQRALQLTTDGMKLDPVNPTLLQGRNAILAANFAAAPAAGDSATEVDIWRGFAARGMGYSASAISSSSGTVVEAFNLPFAIGTPTILSDSCDSNGVVDPGETVTLSVPVSNSFQMTTVTDVMVSLAGGSSASYGSLAPGESATRNFTFTVPSNATCGMKIALNFTVQSNFGTDTSSTVLQVGTATGTLSAGSFSSGNLAMPIPDLATVEAPIHVTSSGLVGDVNVSVRLNHTWVSDLTISLVAPDGTTVALASGRGGSGDNFGTGANDCSGTPTTFDDSAASPISAGVAPFTGSFRPDSPLAGFNGKSMSGVWKLRISDSFNEDPGVLGCVTLQLNQQLFYCCGVAGIPLIQAAPPATLVAECASAANGAPDPGEIVTMNFPLRNTGSGLTTNLVATLQNSGGITSLGGPQSYGVLSPVGPAVSRPFQFSISSSIACGADAVATLVLQDGALALGSVSFNIRTGAVISNTYGPFTNSALIKIPATGSGAGSGSPSLPYPSTIEVSGVAGTVVGTQLSVLGFSHTFPADVDMLLVGPGGQKFTVLSDVGGSLDIVNLNITLDDAAALPLSSSALTSGTFRPTNSGATDAFPAPAPAAPYSSPAPGGSATFASVFGGSNPNGTWKLYVADDAGADVGALNGGWSLTFRTADPSCSVLNSPTITGESVDKPALWPANHKMVDVAVNYTVSDCANCALSITSNEPINGTGDGDTAPDWEVVSNNSVRLRAERAGNGTGRIYTITITCSNGSGTTVRTVPVHVAHDIGSPKAGSSFRIDTPVSFAGTFWDLPGRTHRASWNFDELSAAGTVVEPSGSRTGSVSGSYSFAEPGVYAVKMNVTDDRNVTASVTNAGEMEAIVVIYDPNGGYVIGGGAFDSPAGAYVANGSVTGKVGYGFNSKYKVGSNLKGETQIIFNAAGLRFEAQTFDYLAISGARAQFAGTGKLNGGGSNTSFILTIMDGGVEGGGGVDRIRMKIFQRNGTVIYDSQPGASDAADPTTAVTSGSSIVIQK